MKEFGFFLQFIGFFMAWMAFTDYRVRRNRFREEWSELTRQEEEHTVNVEKRQQFEKDQSICIRIILVFFFVGIAGTILKE